MLSLQLKSGEYLTIGNDIVVQVFEQASNRLGNMNGRQEQFAIGFLGIINNYLLVAGEQAENAVQISDETKISLVNQFMYGIFS